MIKTYLTMGGSPKVKFKGSVKILKHDMVRIMWSMIEHGEDSRQALTEAIAEVNFAIKHMENGKGDIEKGYDGNKILWPYK